MAPTNGGERAGVSFDGLRTNGGAGGSRIAPTNGGRRCWRGVSFDRLRTNGGAFANRPYERAGLLCVAALEGDGHHDADGDGKED